MAASKCRDRKPLSPGGRGVGERGVNRGPGYRLYSMGVDIRYLEELAVL